MIRNHGFCVSLLTICLSSASYATTPSPTNSEPKPIDIWTDGFAKSDADKLVGIALGLSGPFRVEGKLGVQQHADPRVADTEKVIWSVSRPAAYQISHSIDLNVSSGGALESLHGSYVQNLTSALTWTAQSTSVLTSKLQMKSNLALDVSKGSSTLVLGPEWVLAVHSIEPLTRTRTELKAGVDYNAPSSGAASLVAKIELRLTPDK
jgi:hypothetical protein